jgi:hypothetical protein
MQAFDNNLLFAWEVLHADILLESATLSADDLRRLVLLYSVPPHSRRKDSRSALTCRTHRTTTSSTRSINSWDSGRSYSACMTKTQRNEGRTYPLQRTASKNEQAGRITIGGVNRKEWRERRAHL